MTPVIVTRFAPSPTGLLHLGHAYSALTAYETARAARGRFLLRIEDIDRARSRPGFETAIAEDLAWLGIDWERPVRRQSEHLAEYGDVLEQLGAMDLLYPCFCTRREIETALTAPHGPEGPVYPGTCRTLSIAERARLLAEGRAFARRLDLAEALATVGPLTFVESGETRAVDTDRLRSELGDVVLARKDVPASYHLAVVHDDALQGVTMVVRGADLAFATPLHRVLQALLGLPSPAYRHHGLVVDAAGRRLAKRDEGLTVRALRAAGVPAAELRTRLLAGEGPTLDGRWAPMLR